MLHCSPGITELLPLGLSGCPLRRHRASGPIETLTVPVLDEEAYWHRPHVEVEQHFSRRLGDQHDHRLASGQNFSRLIQDLRRNHDVGDDLDDLLRRGPIELTVDCNHSAERGNLVAFIGHAVGEGQVVRDRQAAWVRVLDDRHRRAIEVVDELKRG